MIFIQRIYNELDEHFGNINTDDFSTEWLLQSRSYYSSLKARQIEAPSKVLMSLLGVINTKKMACEAGAAKQGSARLKSVAGMYGALADVVAEEIARKALAETINSKKCLEVREILLRSVKRLLEDEERKALGESRYAAPAIAI